MAILTEVPGLSVCIKISDQVATEYRDPGENEVEEPSVPTNQCYVESKDGAEFSVSVMTTSDLCVSEGYHLLVQIYLDGTQMRGVFINSNQLRAPYHETEINETRYLSGRRWVARRFVFVPAKVDENDEAMGDFEPQNIKHVGKVKVVIYSCKRKIGRLQTRSRRSADNKSSLVVSKKIVSGAALSHGVSFSSETSIPRPLQYLPTEKQELGVFVFKYRSHVSLQNELVIPRTPSPEPPTLESQLISMSQEEILRFAKKGLQMSEDSRMLKREAELSDTTPISLKRIERRDGKDAFDLTED